MVSNSRRLSLLNTINHLTSEFKVRSMMENNLHEKYQMEVFGYELENNSDKVIRRNVLNLNDVWK